MKLIKSIPRDFAKPKSRQILTIFKIFLLLFFYDLFSLHVFIHSFDAYSANFTENSFENKEKIRVWQVYNRQYGIWDLET